MKSIFIAIASLSIFTAAPAYSFYDSYDYEADAYESEEIMRRGPRAPGRPGPSPRPNPGRPHPRPNPYPRPNPIPAPPHYRVQNVTCTSYAYRYNECYFHAFNVIRIRIIRQHSYDACVWGRSAGSHGHNRVWVSNGCSATFEIVSQ